MTAHRLKHLDHVDFVQRDAQVTRKLLAVLQDSSESNNGGNPFPLGIMFLVWVGIYSKL